MHTRRLAFALFAAAVGVVSALALVDGRLDTGHPAAAAPVGGSEGAAHTARPVRARVAPGPVCTAGSEVRLDSPRRALAVTVVRRAVAYRRPGAGRIAAFGRLTLNRVPTVLGVLAARVDTACRAVWYRVQLPLRPNGTTGWVRATAVTEKVVRTRIVVDLTARRVTLYRSGKAVLVVPAAIGSPSTPTPTGRYYVNQKLVAPDPLGPFGPAALGISAFSPVLRSWAQGGPIAIHGTNEATLLGSAVSHGCIRVSNEDDLRLFRLAPTGTPVLIRM